MEPLEGYGELLGGVDLRHHHYPLTKGDRDGVLKGRHSLLEGRVASALK